MAKINSFVAKLIRDHPEISFISGEDFSWSPSTKTIHYRDDPSAEGKLTLLHEVAHATLAHSEFRRDIELLKMERQAWEYVEHTLAPLYGLTTDEDTVQAMIDTYREWLHARSRCPHCSLTGIQTDTNLYHCLGCSHDWRVNEARRCGLKRYSLTH